MKNEDKRNIPSTRVTISASEPGDPRNKTVVNVSAHRSDNRSKKSDDSVGAPERRREQSNDLSTGAKRSLRAFVIELIISVLLLAAVCAFRRILVYANNTDLMSFPEVAKNIIIYICVSVAVFAFLRILFRRPYFVCVFVAFGTFLIINLDWLAAFMRLFVNESRPSSDSSSSSGCFIKRRSSYRFW